MSTNDKLRWLIAYLKKRKDALRAQTMLYPDGEEILTNLYGRTNELTTIIGFLKYIAEGAEKESAEDESDEADRPCDCLAGKL